jgi:hypothetical protein
MKGVLTIDQQLAVLSKIWGNDREGFVFVPWIDGKANDKKARRAAYHEGPAFEWPGDRDKIGEWLAQHPNDDVYFAPCLFEDKRRIEQAAAPERTLWADLDEVDPRELAVDGLRPTIAWESSPGRFQGIWMLDKPRIGASWPGDINHRLTMHLGADPSGWDTTQLLRVPGRRNHKPDYRAANGGKPVEGQLLWDTGRRFFIDDDFADLPEVGVVDLGGQDVDLMDASVIDAVDRHAVWARVRLQMPIKTREFMAVRSGRIADEIGSDQPEGRSGIQWQIMCDLAKCGCTVAEIVAVIRPTVWNTFRDRRDELKRLKIGAAKAVAKAKADQASDEADEGDALEEIGADKPEITWLFDVMQVAMRRPRWLVNNVWSDNGCGFIAGDPKSYKSWTGLDLAVSVATGGNFLNDPGMRVVGGARPFLYLQEEDSEIVVRDRLDNIVEGKCPDLHWHGRVSRDPGPGGTVWWSPADGNIPLGFHVRAGFVASDIGWQQWLADMLMEGSFAGVVIDTLGTTAGEVDTDRAQELMTKILRPMREISHQTHTAICVVHHNRKGSGNGGERGGARMLGSVALHAWVDDAIYLHSREQKAGGVTKLRVERESKAAVEHRFVLEIPRMGVSGADGSRTVWNPTVGLWEDSGGVAVTGDHDVPVSSNGGTRKRAPAGSMMCVYIKSSGGTGPHRPIPMSTLMKKLDKRESDVWKQVQSGINNGLIGGTREGGVWVIEQ